MNLHSSIPSFALASPWVAEMRTHGHPFPICIYHYIYLIQCRDTSGGVVPGLKLRLRGPC